jgi:hypothetical protein
MMKRMSGMCVWMAGLLALGTLGSGCGREAGDAMENAVVGAQEFVAGLGGQDAEPLVVRKARLEQQRRENREWTPRNIASHPDLYMEYCRKVLEELRSETAGNLLSTRALLKKCEREMEAVDKDTADAKAFLKEAAAKAGGEATVYPVDVFGYLYTEAMFGEAVQKAARIVNDAAGKRAALVTRRQVLETHLERLKGEAARIEAETADLESKLEQARAAMGKKQLEEVGGKLSSLLDGIQAIEWDVPIAVKRPEPAAVSDILAEYR